MHFVDEGPERAEAVFLLHGEPSWCYLYRKMIPAITAAGYRALAPDLIGFGRSDKLVRKEDYSYQFHVSTIAGFLCALKLEAITVGGQDWGGLIGLRVATENPQSGARPYAATSALPPRPTPHSAHPTLSLHHPPKAPNTQHD